MAKYIAQPLPEHVSHSQVSTFLDCGEKYRYSYIEGLPRPSTPSLIVGQTYHRALETAFQKRINGVTVNDEDIKRITAIAWDDVIVEAGNSKGGIDWQDVEATVLYSQAMALVALYWKELGCEIQPLLIEENFRVDVPGVPVPFVGIIDLITADGAVIDHKTAGRAWPASRVEKDLQATAYLYALWKMDGELRKSLRFDVAIKTAKPKIVTYEAHRTMDQLLWYERLLQRVWAAISARVFVPNPTGWLCSPKFCSFWTQCTEGER